MRRGVFWDSSAILALLDADDANHGDAVEAAERIARERCPSFMTNYVEAETHALLLRQLGRRAALDWLLRADFRADRALPEDEARARELLAKHDDKDWSLCDAISFAVIERSGLRRVFSFDRHFRQYGKWEVLGPKAR